MKIADRSDEGVLHLRLEGIEALESANAASAKAEILSRMDGANDVVLDMAGVCFIDSAGVASLVSLYKHIRARGRRLRFARVAPEVAAVLRIVKLDQIFEIFPDAETAARSLRPRPFGLAGSGPSRR
jgi:anti-sigma B factor antagonist